MVERIYLILGDSIVAFQKKLWYSATGIPYFEVTSPKTISLKPKREMKSKIPKKFLEMIAQRRDKTTPGSFLAGVLTHGIFYDSRRILKGPWYSYSNYLNRFLFFSLSVCLSEVIFTWHFPRSRSAEFSQNFPGACQPTDFSTFSPIETLT